MNRPGLVIRIAGRPVIAALLFLSFGVLVVAWLAGEISWWLGPLALFAALQTLAAAGQLRRYKTWSAEWQAMGAPLGTAAPAPSPSSQQQSGPKISKAKRGRMSVAVAAVLVVGIPAFVSHNADVSDGGAGILACLWVLPCLYLLWRFVTLFRRGNRSVAPATKQRHVTDDAGYIAWLLPRASSSPSRDAAQRHLPDYCARLLSRG